MILKLGIGQELKAKYVKAQQDLIAKQTPLQNQLIQAQASFAESSKQATF